MCRFEYPDLSSTDAGSKALSTLGRSHQNKIMLWTRDHDSSGFVSHLQGVGHPGSAGVADVDDHEGVGLGWVIVHREVGVAADDFDILLMTQSKNMAAFDGLREKTDPIMSKVMGSEDSRRQLAVKRLDVREILGTKTMREVTLK